MSAAQKKAFMQRLTAIESAPQSYPYAGWVTIEDAKTPAECRALAGTAWRGVGSTLRARAEQHFVLGLKDCRCRLVPLTARTLKEDAADWRVMG